MGILTTRATESRHTREGDNFSGSGHNVRQSGPYTSAGRGGRRSEKMGGPVDLFVCVFMYICVCVNCILGVCTGACVHVSFFVSFYDCMCVFMLCSILEGS